MNLIKHIPYVAHKQSLVAFIDGIRFEIVLDDAMSGNKHNTVYHNDLEYDLSEADVHTLYLKLADNLFATMNQIHEAIMEDWSGGERSEYLNELGDELLHEKEMSSPYYTGRV